MLHSLNVEWFRVASMVPFMVMISHAHGVWSSTRETTFISFLISVSRLLQGAAAHIS